MAVSPSTVPLEVVVRHKKLGIHASHVHYRVLVPPGEIIEAELTVPEGVVYLVPGEIHDVPIDTFTHRCYKDDILILPETLIDGTSMALNYPEPFLVYRGWRGVVRNVSDRPAMFRLRVPILVIPRHAIKLIESKPAIEDLLLEVVEALKGYRPSTRLTQHLAREFEEVIA
jgi:hypothetical protein